MTLRRLLLILAPLLAVAASAPLASASTVVTPAGSDAILSADGSALYFTSYAALDPSDTDDDADVYMTRNGTTTLVSGPGSVGPGSEDDTELLAVSAGGDRAVFVTDQALLGSDTNDAGDLYEWDAGTVERLSTSPTDTSTANEQRPELGGMTPDGSHVFFSGPGRLLAGGATMDYDLYESTGGTLSRVAKNGFFGFTTADGSTVVFTSAEDLAGSTAGLTAPYLYKRSGGTTTLLSSATGSGVAGHNTFNSGSSFLAATPDASHILFESPDGLTADDQRPSDDIFDRSGATLTLVSTGPGNTNETGDLGEGYAVGAVNADASKVIFDFDAPLVAGTHNADGQVYLRSGGTTTLLSTGPTDTHHASSFFKAASSDLGTVVFSSGGGLTADDTDGDGDDLYARTGATTTLLSGAGSGDTDFKWASTDASKVMFTTDDPLVAMDCDDLPDVYENDNGVLELVSTGTPDVSADFAGATSDGSTAYYTAYADADAEDNGDETEIRSTTPGPSGTACDSDGSSSSSGDGGGGGGGGGGGTTTTTTPEATTTQSAPSTTPPLVLADLPVRISRTAPMVLPIQRPGGTVGVPTKTRTAAFTVVNQNDFDVTGAAKLLRSGIVLGTGTFRSKAGATAPISLRINDRGLHALRVAKTHRLTVSLVIDIRDPFGTLARVTRSYVLSLPVGSNAAKVRG